MKPRIDSAEGRRHYGHHIGTVEPVYGKIRQNKLINRFTLLRRKRVDALW
mgnify:CR=1 FL=1|jgi:hypothetical protein